MKAPDPTLARRPAPRRTPPRRRGAAFVTAVLMTAFVLVWADQAQAQAPAPAVPPAPGQFGPPPLPGQAGLAPAPGAAPAAPAMAAPGSEFHLRVGVSLIDQMSFTAHPFYQITEDGSYVNGRAAGATAFTFGVRESDSDASFLTRLVHALPPFGIEGLTNTGLFLPRGIGLGFDYSPLSQRDAEATNGQAGVTPIRMDLYYYSSVLRFYIFDPNEPGLNYFVGFGLGFIEGKIIAQQAVGAPEQKLSLSQSAVGSKRLGLETRGDNWGVRYEISVVNADEVTLDSNPYLDLQGNGPNATAIDMSGTLVRISMFYHF